MNCATTSESVNRSYLYSMKRNLFIVLFVFPLLVTGQPKIPELWERVHDEARILSEPFVHQLEQGLQIHEDSTSNQIAVLIIPTLADYPIESYTLAVAEKWKLGQKENDNGVLLFIAVDDRKVRIEVGEGLEGVLTDALTNRIIRNELAPYFRQGDYEGGIQAAINAIIQAIAGEYQAESASTSSGRGRGGSMLPFLIVLIIIIIISRIRGGRGGHRGGGWSSGSGWYGGGWSGGGGGWSGGGGFSGGGGGFGGGGSSGSW